MGHNVICISRHEGAGADELARAVADALGFRLIDEDIVTRAALEAGVEEEVIADLERGRSALERLIESFAAAGAGSGFVPVQAGSGRPLASVELRGLVRSVIEEIAGEGGVVILAHAASLALCERDDVLRVLVTASPRTRALRLARALEIEESQAARAVRRSDVARADYIKRFHGIGSELPTHYDLVINTDRLSAEKAASLILAAGSAAGTNATVAVSG